MDMRRSYLALICFLLTASLAIFIHLYGNLSTRKHRAKNDKSEQVENQVHNKADPSGSAAGNNGIPGYERIESPGSGKIRKENSIKIVVPVRSIQEWSKIVDRKGGPVLQEIKEWNDEDMRLVLHQYQQEQDQRRRRNLLKVITYIGNDEAATVLLKELIKGPDESSQDELITKERKDQLVGLCEWMGILANRSSVAADLIRDGVRIQYWRDQKQWRSEEPVLEDSIMAEACIRASGFYTNANLDDLAQTISSQSNLNDIQWYISSHITTAFYRDRVMVDGLAGFMDQFNDIGMVVRQYVAWKTNSANGRKWTAWEINERRRSQEKR